VSDRTLGRGVTRGAGPARALAAAVTGTRIVFRPQDADPEVIDRCYGVAIITRFLLGHRANGQNHSGALGSGHTCAMFIVCAER
jgi:hypothetical protein